MTNKKKIIIYGLVAILLTVLVLTGLSLYPLGDIRQIIKDYKTETAWTEMKEKYTPNEFLICSFDFVNPEFISIEGRDGNINSNSIYTFYSAKRDNILSQNFTLKYNGGGYINNLDSIDQFTKMVKDNCEQFRQSYPSPTNPRKDGDDTDISWIYSRPPTDKEIKEQERLVEMRRERNEREQKEAREGNYLLFEEYADIYNSLSDDEIILLTDLEQNEDYSEYEIGLWMKENGYTDREINWDYIDYYRYDDSDEDEVWNKINSRYRSVFPDGFINEE